MPDYLIHCARGGETFWHKVEAEPVNIPGFEGCDLFVHHDADVPDDYHERGWWHVSEGRTGMYCGHGRTKERAIRDVARRLCKVGPDRLRSVVKRYERIHGLSPRYQEEVSRNA